MKKILKSVAMLVVFCVITSISVYALDPYWVERLQDMNWSQADITSFDEVQQISQEQFPDKIIASYMRLKSWEEVRKEYGITDEKYAEWKKGQEERNKILDIPQYIYDEMKEKGYTKQQQKELIFQAASVQFDIELVWAEIKKGRTLDDLFNERAEKEKENSKILTDFVNGIIDIDAYTTQVKRTDNTKISDLLDFAVNKRKEMRDHHIKESGITEEEMNLCREYNVTNIMDMCQAKYISTRNKLNLKKVVEVKKDVANWTKVVSILLNIPLEELEKSNADAIKK